MNRKSMQQAGAMAGEHMQQHHGKSAPAEKSATPQPDAMTAQKSTMDQCKAKGMSDCPNC